MCVIGNRNHNFISPCCPLKLANSTHEKYMCFGVIGSRASFSFVSRWPFAASKRENQHLWCVEQMSRVCWSLGVSPENCWSPQTPPASFLVVLSECLCWAFSRVKRVENRSRWRGSTLDRKSLLVVSLFSRAVLVLSHGGSFRAEHHSRARFNY